MNELATNPSLDSISATGRDWIESITPNFTFDSVFESITQGKMAFDFEGIINRIIGLFTKEVSNNMKTMASLIAIVILCAILSNMQSAFGKTSIETVAMLSCSMYVIGIGIGAFSQALFFAKSAINDMIVLMNVLIPSIATLLVSSGLPTSGAAMQPLVFGASQIMQIIINSLVIPLSILALVVSLLGNINEENNFSAFSGVLKSFYKYILGVSMTIFTAILTITKFASASFDSVTAKGIKFAVSSMVPVVGGSLSDAMESIIGASKLAKSAVGGAGMIAIIAITLVPVLKICAMVFMYRVTSVILETVADKKIVKILNDMADCLVILLVSIACSGIIILISLGAMIGVST